MMMLETDNELAQGTLAGSRLAAGQLAERHRGTAYRTAYQALGNADDAQDVAQEALVYALQRLPDLRDEGKFAPWLRQVTLSLCADYRRRRGTRRLGEPLTVLNEASEEADYVERLAVRQAVAHLSEAHRTTLLLHYVGGWALEEVAVLLQVPLNTVRSRLMAAKRLLRAELPAPATLSLKRNLMTTQTFTLPETHTSLIQAAFPGARILSVQADPEPWMPFAPRIGLALADGTERTIDFRGDIDPARAALLPVLERSGVPSPRLIYGPVSDGAGRPLCLCEAPRGENLLLWALGGTPHRIRLATERAFESIDRLQGLTDVLQADPVGAMLPRRTLADEAAALFDPQRWAADPWLAGEGEGVTAWDTDPWYKAARDKVRTVVADIRDPLVFTDYLHFFPNWVRVYPAADFPDAPLGWPGDARMQANPLAEYVSPFGHFGDPLLGLAMVWIYDCYPFVHTGFVEQYLWRRNLTRRDFAPRLALRALQTIRRELPVARPAEGGEYWDGLRGYVEQGLAWL